MSLDNTTAIMIVTAMEVIKLTNGPNFVNIMSATGCHGAYR